MALESYNAAAAKLNDAADAIISAFASDKAALDQAQSDLANADAQATAVIQPIIDKLTAALPPPALAPAGEPFGTAQAAG